MKNFEKKLAVTLVVPTSPKAIAQSKMPNLEPKVSARNLKSPDIIPQLTELVEEIPDPEQARKIQRANRRLEFVEPGIPGTGKKRSLFKRVASQEHNCLRIKVTDTD
jgi:hypothetical protein